MSYEKAGERNLPSSKNEELVALGAGFGVAIGTGIGTALGDIAIGAAMGVAVGAGVGAALMQSRNRQKKS